MLNVKFRITELVHAESAAEGAPGVDDTSPEVELNLPAAILKNAQSVVSKRPTQDAATQTHADIRLIKLRAERFQALHQHYEAQEISQAEQQKRQVLVDTAFEERDLFRKERDQALVHNIGLNAHKCRLEAEHKEVRGLLQQQDQALEEAQARQHEHKSTVEALKAALGRENALEEEIARILCALEDSKKRFHELETAARIVFRIPAEMQDGEQSGSTSTLSALRRSASSQ